MLAFIASATKSVAEEPPAMRRLTEAQYRNSIAEVFGDGIKIAGRFEPDLRIEGLVAVGSGRVGISPAGLEQYDGMARNISEQVLSPERRDKIMPCKPAEQGFDRKCAAQLFSSVGERLYRRPVSAAEVKRLTAVAESSAKLLGGFYPGVQSALAGMLVSPSFLYRIDYATKGTDNVDGYSKAARLSYFLVNSTPDAELLAAAGRGELDNQAGYEKQVDRLLASPKLERGVRAFFWDMLRLDKFASLSKDAEIYPAVNPKTGTAAEEQTLKTIVYHLMTQDGDYRELFTTRQTFMNRPLGLIYQVPVRTQKDWELYTFPEDADRAGVLTDFSFLALHSHPGRSSPTLRGQAIREIFLCQVIPPPPPNVDFTVVQDTSNTQFKTARDRLTAHRTQPACNGCHRLMDPIGLSLERFDGAAMFRANENGTPINMEGSLDGANYSDAKGLGKAIAASPRINSCLVNNMYRYALGRDVMPDEKTAVNNLVSQFGSDGYRLRKLMRRVALSDAFQKVSVPSLKQKPSTVAGELHGRQFLGKAK